ncbi:hypothetical protein ACOSQ2_010278 [Xanthoceras sorbifolium]
MSQGNNNAVIITYYVESPAIRSHHLHPFRRKPQTKRKLGCDRRSELLAYANDLRTADSQNLNPPRKPKRWKWCSAPAKLQVMFLQICQGNKGEWKYTRMASKEKTETVDSLDGVEGVNSRKKESSERRRSDPHFCRKLKSTLKELVFGCHRNKGWKR